MVLTEEHRGQEQGPSSEPVGQKIPPGYVTEFGTWRQIPRTRHVVKNTRNIRRGG